MVKSTASTTNTQLKKCRQIVWDYYALNKRIFPWRETHDPYKIVVSEIMLQQTQADRVVVKYNAFIKKWPTVQKLARADLRDVLKEWSGLGYNRRGKNLWLLAKEVVANHGGIMPKTISQLEDLPGIGPYTARAIVAFAYNTPSPFIETNIRAVFIYFFFPDSENKIADAELFPLIEKAVDTENPREWYYALMDYGAYLKKNKLSTNVRHKNYRTQTKFKGSLREARGAIMRELVVSQTTLRKLKEKIKLPETRIAAALDALTKEGIIRKKGATFFIAE